MSDYHAGAHGENGVALYVGKSINLRSRVMAHFAGDHRDSRDMKIAQQVKRVDWVETAGELGALIEEARLVKELAPVYNQLVLGLEKGQGPCFAHQLKRCRGACVGKETRVAHGLRPGAALARLRMRPWPFRGRIGVRENRAGALLVLDRWCYLGTVQSESELAELAGERQQPRFDLDTYKILSRAFASSRRDYQVVDLAA